jgi:hypothetical protein
MPTAKTSTDAVAKTSNTAETAMAAMAIPWPAILRGLRFAATRATMPRMRPGIAVNPHVTRPTHASTSAVIASALDGGPSGRSAGTSP